MEIKPGYKQTEVGVIPEDWSVKPVRAIAAPIKNALVGGPFGSNLTSKDYAETGVPVIRGQNMGGPTVSGNFVFVSTQKADSLSANLARPRDLIFTQRGTLGQVSLVSDHPYDKYVISQSQMKLTVDRRQADPFFYYHAFSGPDQQKLIQANTIQTGVPHINLGILRAISVSQPPLPEQKAIAEAMSDADAFINSLVLLLIKKRQIKQGAMQELLTGKKRRPVAKSARQKQTEIGCLPDEWEVRKIGEVASVKTGPFGSSLHERDYVDNGTPIITVEHLGERGVEHINLPMVSDADRKRLKTYSLEEGDIVFSRVGSVDRNALVSKAEHGWLFSGRLLRLRASSRDIDTQFLSYQFHSEPFKQRVISVAVGQTMASLNTKILKSVLIAVPPHPEQAAIAAILEGMDAEIAALNAKLTKARQLKQGMMQELLTGRIRLIRPSAQVLSFPAKESASATDISHNTHFNEAVVTAVLSAKFGSETFPLGRFRRTKLSYLLHRHVEHEAAGFMKKAAGPYNPRTRYGGAEKIALQNRYVRVLSTGKSEGFVAAENIAQAEGYFEKWYGAEALTWLEQFRYQKNDALELLTTVDMACEDLSRVGKAATLSAVKQIIHDSPEWKAKLNRAVFSDDNIATTIQSCGQLFPFEEE